MQSGKEKTVFIFEAEEKFGLAYIHLYLTASPDFVQLIFTGVVLETSVSNVVLFGGEERLKAVSNGFPLFRVIALGPLAAFNESFA